MDGTEPRNPFTTRGFIFGTAIVGVLALAAVVLAVTSPWADGGGENTPAAIGPTTIATAAVPADAASVCGLDGYEESGTLTSPPTAQWSIVGTMVAPGSATAGPGVTDAEGVRSCYAHTVEGAVTASANLWAMGSDARLGQLATEQLTVPGVGRDAAIARETGKSSNGLSAQIAGFKVLSYTGTDATIDIAFKLSNGSLASSAQALRWSEGDWKVLVTDQGTSPYTPVVLQSLGGYVGWAGVE